MIEMAQLMEMLVAGIEVTKSAKDTYKKFQELSSEIKNIEDRSAMLALRKLLIEFQEREMDLLQEIATLKLKLEEKQSLRFDGVVFKDDQECCYCPTCYQSGECRLVKLSSCDPDEIESWHCSVCKGSVETKGATLRRRQRVAEATRRLGRCGF